jgi:hypothetical protein
MGVVQEIKCSHCGAPITFEPGEMLATCKYCGFTVVIETGQPFTFEHSLLLNKYDPTRVEEPVRSWMREGFLKPSDLARKSKIVEKELIYLPFWVVSVEARSSYKGIFERITPAVVKEGTIEKEYDWLVLARKATEFPTRDYEVPLEAKINYDFRRIEAFAKVLNSEMDKNGAEEQAKQEIEGNHRFLAQQDVDRIVDMKTEVKVEEAVYLHAPLWFIKYEYKGKDYQLIVDGATGTAVKGDIPPAGFGIL